MMNTDESLVDQLAADVLDQKVELSEGTKMKYPALLTVVASGGRVKLRQLLPFLHDVPVSLFSEWVTEAYDARIEPSYRARDITEDRESSGMAELDDVLLKKIKARILDAQL